MLHTFDVILAYDYTPAQVERYETDTESLLLAIQEAFRHGIIQLDNARDLRAIIVRDIATNRVYVYTGITYDTIP